MIGAIGIDGLLTQMSILGAEDSLTFEAFIATKLAPKLWIGAYVFMDNCSIRKGENIGSPKKERMNIEEENHCSDG